MGGLSYIVTPGGLSKEDHDRIFALAQRGLKCGPIARQLSKHPATVRWFMFRNGLVEPKLRHSMPVSRANSAGRKGYSQEEDNFITALRAENVPLNQIAARVSERFGHKRTPHGVLVRLTMLGARDDG